MKRDKLLAVLVILLGTVLIAATLLYLLTDQMILGLIPICSAVLMVPMMQLWRGKENGMLYSILFLIAGVLNLIAAVMQILSAL